MLKMACEKRNLKAISGHQLAKRSINGEKLANISGQRRHRKRYGGEKLSRKRNRATKKAEKMAGEEERINGERRNTAKKNIGNVENGSNSSIARNEKSKASA